MMAKHEVVQGDTLSTLAERYYGDARLFRVIAVANHLPDPDLILVGQELVVPYVTYRHRVVAGDTKSGLAAKFSHDTAMRGVIEIANHAAQRDIRVGEWLLIPDLGDVGHHTLVAGETLQDLALRWYGEANLWPIISIANHLEDEPPLGTVLIQPRLNGRHTVVAGDTLSQLALETYGPGDLDTKVALVAAANLIPDPNLIRVGQVLFFPSTN
ncbi:LysM peptidoglycan-binding domain-containing protein [Rhodococcus sp. NPDC003348]